MIFGPVDEAASARNAAARERLGDDLVVLRVSGKQGPEMDADRLVDDPSGKVAQVYGAQPGAVILVRPDGHIAWRSPKADRRGLEAWLDGVLPECRPADKDAVGP